VPIVPVQKGTMSIIDKLYMIFYRLDDSFVIRKSDEGCWAGISTQEQFRMWGMFCDRWRVVCPPSMEKNEWKCGTRVRKDA
jgi:hypothetical protein